MYQIPPAVSLKISRLRRLIRLYVLIESAAGVVIVLGGAFWAALALDWLLEPSPAVRLLMWTSAVLLTGATLVRLLFRRLFAPLPAASLALSVERSYPDLREALVTAVQPTHVDTSSSLHPELLRRTGAQASAAMERVKLARVIAWRPLMRKVSAAIALIGSISAFAALQHDAFGLWVERMRLSERPWPRRVELTVTGFEEVDGRQVCSVAQGDEFDVDVLASIVDGHEAPDQIEIRWRIDGDDNARGRGAMVRVGEAIPGRDKSQRYRFTFHVAGDILFDVFGGDDSVRNLRLRAAPRPVVQGMTILVDYPTYMQRSSATFDVSGRAEIPEGARIECRVTASKPLRFVQIDDAEKKETWSGEIDEANPAKFRVDLGALRSDRTLSVGLIDHEGISSRDAYRLVLMVKEDKPPEASVQLRGIGTAIVPQAILPLTGRVTDDYELIDVWFDYQVDDQPIAQRQLTAQVAGQQELRALEAFDLAQTDLQTRRPLVELQPGQKLSLALKARDAYDLSDKPHDGSSQRFILDVVTPAELRGILERQELGLRQRFEAIHEKMVGTCELLDRVDPAKIDDERLKQRDVARIAGSRQNAAQLAFETLGASEGFEEIVAELVNNRIDTEELKERLLVGVVQPLAHIGTTLLPQLEQELESLGEVFRADPPQAGLPLAGAQAKARGVAAAMQEVLDRMLELESYNELVELLRDIVRQQERLNDETKSIQRERLRKLLED